MVALSRCIGSLLMAGGIIGGDGARMKRQTKDNAEKPSKFIAGVPVVNYDSAYGGESLGEKAEALEVGWLMATEEGVTDEKIDALCDMVKNGCSLIGEPSKGGVPFFHMKTRESVLEEVLKSAEGAVSFVARDEEYTIIPEIGGGASIATASWGLERVGTPTRPNEGQGVHIYILDTGIRTTHNDFGGRAFSALDVSSGTPEECNGRVGCADDVQGHGTHCAGTAAGTRFGVAPKAALHSVKVLGDNGAGSFAGIIGGMDFIAIKGKRPTVASMSLGGPIPNPLIGNAVDAMVEAGVTVVVAAGNSNIYACLFSPAFVGSAITVGSTTDTDERSSFSNYGRCTNIWAPGSAIVSASHKSDTGSWAASGTSMACPHVAGGAALVLEKAPQLQAPEVLKILLDNAATDAVSDLGWGDSNKLLFVGEGGAPPGEKDGECPSYCKLCWMQKCKDTCSFC